MGNWTSKMAWNSKKKKAVKFLLQEANGIHVREVYGEKGHFSNWNERASISPTHLVRWKDGLCH